MRSISGLINIVLSWLRQDSPSDESGKVVRWAQQNRLRVIPVHIRHNRFRHNGFTLVELLTVVAIIATLFSLLIPTMQNAVLQSRKVYCINNLRNIALGFAQYHAEFNRYPLPNYWLNDFRPVESYIKSYKVFRCPSSRLPMVTDYDQLLTWTDYLFSPGTIKDIELSVSQFNNGHGNNIYNFDPSNPSPQTKALIAAKRTDRFVYDRYVPAHPRKTVNLVKVDDLSYESIYGAKTLWMIDNQGRLIRSLVDFPPQ